MMKSLDIFLIFAQNIDCGYKLEPPKRAGSNEYPQRMFWIKSRKIRYIPANHSFSCNTCPCWHRFSLNINKHSPIVFSRRELIAWQCQITIIKQLLRMRIVLGCTNLKKHGGDGSDGIKSLRKLKKDADLFIVKDTSCRYDKKYQRDL